MTRKLDMQYKENEVINQIWSDYKDAYRINIQKIIYFQ